MNNCVLLTLPARLRDNLLARSALAVSPAPRALPTRAHAAAWIPRGNYRLQIMERIKHLSFVCECWGLQIIFGKNYVST